MEEGRSSIDNESEQQVLVAFFVSNSGVDVEDIVRSLLDLCAKLARLHGSIHILPISAIPLGKTGKQI